MTASSSLPSKRFVSTEWLAEHLGDPNVAIVDGSFYLAALKRDATAEYLAAHIPGAGIAIPPIVAVFNPVQIPNSEVEFRKTPPRALKPATPFMNIPAAA